MRLCPRCRRANPDEASFCHYDGVALVQQFQSIGPEIDWIFSDGRRCQTIDELARGCLAEWSEACTAVTSGHFRDHFEHSRPDLARAADKAMELADKNVALQTFLDELRETTVFVRPIVDLTPRRLNVDEVRRGEIRLVPLRLINRGQGYLHGTISIAEGERWLSLINGESPVQASWIGLRLEQELTIRIDPAHLPAAGSYLGRIRIETNGGNIEVPVQVNIVSHPVDFMGHAVNSEREFAKVLRDHPREAVRWLNDGRVQRFYLENGWDFRVKGEIAPGFAGIQQFFEASRFAQPPELHIDPPEIDAICVFPELITRRIELSTWEKKWVYAFVESDDVWLKPLDPVVSGLQSIAVPIEIDSGLMEPGQARESLLRITANGEQTFFIRVRVSVRRSR